MNTVSPQHPLQLLNPLQDLLLDRPQFNQELLGAVEAEVVALGAAAG